MAKKHTKLFPSTKNFQMSCLPGTVESAQKWLSQFLQIAAGLSEEEKTSARIYITAERGVEVWYYKTVSDAEINAQQEQFLLESLLKTPTEDMTDEWKAKVLAEYNRIEQGDSLPS